MRNKETGEFELVVGDKQLLSGFFIGVLLLAVVFAMGYVLGQNSPHSPKPAETAAAPPASGQDARPQPAFGGASTPSTEPSAPPATPPADAAQAGATPQAEKPPEPSTQPAREPSAASAPPAAAPTVGEPRPGSYWQVTASASPSSAEAVYQTLKNQGFSSQIRPGPNGLTVVWVGPYNDKDSLSQAKKRLEDAGFSNLLKRP